MREAITYKPKTCKHAVAQLQPLAQIIATLPYPAMGLSYWRNHPPRAAAGVARRAKTAAPGATTSPKNIAAPRTRATAPSAEIAAASAVTAAASAVTAAASAVLRVPRVIKVGSDFSGMEAGITGLTRMKVPFHLEFSSDNQRCCKNYIQNVHKPKKLFEDITKRTAAEEIPVHLYIWTPPCQSFSYAGKMDGTAGNGKLLALGVQFIKRNQPRVTIMENVVALGSRRFRPVLKGLMKAIEHVGYKVFVKILDSQHYKTPQARRRLFLVGIRGDSLRHHFHWPAQLGSKTIEEILDTPSKNDVPGKLPPTVMGKERCKEAFKKVYQKQNVNPLEKPVLVDIDCSKRYSTVGVNIARTLTRSRGAVGGPWVSTRGRRVSIHEMVKIMGFFPEEVPWEASGLSQRQIGAMLGNSVAVPVISAVLAEALYAAGLTAQKAVVVH